MLLVLEDNAERIERFEAVMRSLAPDLPIRIWHDSHKMMREVPPFLPIASLLSLDHDLEPTNAGEDPGDGYMVAQWLTSQPIRRPVVIHTSNGERATWMTGAFDLEGWKTVRVLPVGDDWIETSWRGAVRRILRKARGKAS
jgi:NAD+-processing family protein with receiver domain